MPPPPPASGIASRLFLGPALRAQPDRRLVRLVRDGYENAFEEIVRRYDRGLRRYAAAIVPAHRADDVAQDTFQKALLALRSAETDVELRPWLFRILRNTALNDLRDQPPAATGVPEHLVAADGPAAAAERHEEIADLMQRLRALPEPQRAAIVMRELEGLSHEEIAAALGVTGGAARQMLYRARRALREAAGALTPLPLLQYLLSGAPGGEAVGEAAAGAGLGAAGLAGGGAVLKAGMATVLVAGSVGAGVVVSQQADDQRRRDAIDIVNGSAGQSGGDQRSGEATTAAFSGEEGSGSGSSGRSGPSAGGSGGSGSGSDSEDAGDSSGPGGGEDGDGTDDSSGPGGGGGDDGGGGDGDRSSGPGDGDDEPDAEDHSGPGGGGDSSGSGSGGDDHSGPGGEDDLPVLSEPTDLPEPDDSPNSGPGSTSSGSGTSGSGSGTSGSGGSGSGISGSGREADDDD